MSDGKIALLHPEELLDKEARGDLTDVERERLEAHLERCEVCRFEREVRADFASDLAGENDDPEEQANAERLLALAFGDKGRPSQPHHPESVVDEADQPKPAPTPTPTPTRISDRPQRRKRRAMRALLLVAAVILVGGVATAAGGRGPQAVWATLSAVWSSPTAPTPTVAESQKPHERAAAPSTPVVWASATAIATTEPPPPPPPEPTATTPTPVAIAFTAPPPPVESAATIFEAANEARRQGDYARALTLHRQLQAKHPTSREAHASHATVGRLLLDRGDAAGALMSFDAYQARGSGPLDEAVLVGRATALERLGRTDEARKAWRTLLTTFPETPYADHARARSQ